MSREKESADTTERGEEESGAAAQGTEDTGSTGGSAREASPEEAEKPTQTEVPRVLGLHTATLAVVANMIGTGAFLTTGYLLKDLVSPVAVLCVWLVGGVFALCGALSYGELAARIPENGGEYTFLSRIYHPALGFVSGWISFVVGFSAPIAAAALAFGQYVQHVQTYTGPGKATSSLYAKGLATCLVVGFTFLHSQNVRVGGLFQNVFTWIKLCLIAFFVGLGIWVGWPGHHGPFWEYGTKSVWDVLGSSAFAVSLVYVTFSYSGWNGVVYFAGEVRNPRRNLPRAMLLGTALVTVIYLGINTMYLVGLPMGQFTGRTDVGGIAASTLFGNAGGLMVSVLIMLAVLSSVSVMIMTGPRVYEKMGAEIPRLAFLSSREKEGGPARAIWLQALVSLLLIWTASFYTLMSYIGFTLSLSAGATVLGVFVMRWREAQGRPTHRDTQERAHQSDDTETESTEDADKNTADTETSEPSDETSYRTWGYPVTPALFIGLCLWMTVFSLYKKPVIVWSGLGTIALGLLLYMVTQRR